MTTGAAWAGTELSSVPFAVGEHRFKTGDDIVIEQVLASSPKLGVGDKVVVRGHYHLASAATANLGLFVTHRPPAGADAVASSQLVRVERGSEAFEISCEIAEAGALHVSFYPVSGGEAFGGVYFSAAAQQSGQERGTPNHSPEPAPGAVH